MEIKNELGYYNITKSPICSLIDKNCNFVLESSLLEILLIVSLKIFKNLFIYYFFQYFCTFMWSSSFDHWLVDLFTSHITKASSYTLYISKRRKINKLENRFQLESKHFHPWCRTLVYVNLRKSMWSRSTPTQVLIVSKRTVQETFREFFQHHSQVKWRVCSRIQLLCHLYSGFKVIVVMFLIALQLGYCPKCWSTMFPWKNWIYLPSLDSILVCFLYFLKILFVTSRNYMRRKESVGTKKFWYLKNRKKKTTHELYDEAVNTQF